MNTKISTLKIKMHYLLIIIPLIFSSCEKQKEQTEDPAEIPIENPEEKERFVGLSYTTWHRESIWNRYWDTPELGAYTSNNRTVSEKHGEWLAYAGVDFVFIDWSNNIDYIYGETQNRPDFDMIETSVPMIFEEWKNIENAPQVAIMLGCPKKPEAFTDGRMQRKVNQVYDMFIANEAFKDQYYTYLGKPLIMVYVGTPSPFQQGLPQWDEDERFTFRYVTGFISEQLNLRTTDRISKYGYWSWEDRGWQTYTKYKGKSECCTVTAASRPANGDEPDHPNYIPAEGRKEGETFKKRWTRARGLDVSTVLVVSWNEWVTSEQPSPEVSKDLEPSVEFGHQYLDLLKEEIEKFKNPEKE